MIPRMTHKERVETLLGQFPVVGLLGARQVGKTTLARQVAAGAAVPIHYFDLEDPDDLARLEEPKLSLSGLRGLVVIDEVQRRPELFPILRVLADREEAPARFLVLGSASPEFLRQSSESLAGRVAYHELGGLNLDEVGMESADSLWRRGGFPRSFTANSDADSNEWRKQFIRTFLERDIPQLGIGIPSEVLRRFWSMLGHYHGQTWKGAELARGLGVGEATVRRYLDILSGTLVVRQLRPWHANLKKRQVKSPKVYLSDSGLLHSLLGIVSTEDLEGHPKVGASWEGFVIRQVVSRLGVDSGECYFWATHAGAELDLLIAKGVKRWGFEIKRTSSPRITPSMRSALQDLQLERLDVIHAGEHSFPLAEKVRAVAFRHLQRDLLALEG